MLLLRFPILSLSLPPYLPPPTTTSHHHHHKHYHHYYHHQARTVDAVEDLTQFLREKSIGAAKNEIAAIQEYVWE